MPGQIGNRNASKNKPWAEALRKAIIQYEDDVVKRKQALHYIAIEVIKKGLAGDPAAIREIGDRLDGKPAQALIGDSDDPLTIMIVKHAND